ncbi:MAG: hypothetical protein KF774_20820 [Planctomyces sp.]|nr:hypothetical protein [Planctomyces sp.]
MTPIDLAVGLSLLIVVAAAVTTLSVAGRFLLSAKTIAVAGEGNEIIIDGDSHKLCDIESFINQGNYSNIGGATHRLCEYVVRTNRGRQFHVSSLRRSAFREMERAEKVYSEHAAGEHRRRIANCGVSEIPPLRLYRQGIGHVLRDGILVATRYFVQGDVIRIGNDDESIALNLNKMSDAMALVILLRDYYQLKGDCPFLRIKD